MLVKGQVPKVLLLRAGSVLWGRRECFNGTGARGVFLLAGMAHVRFHKGNTNSATKPYRVARAKRHVYRPWDHAHTPTPIETCLLVALFH